MTRLSRSVQQCAAIAAFSALLAATACSQANLQSTPVSKPTYSQESQAQNYLDTFVVQPKTFNKIASYIQDNGDSVGIRTGIIISPDGRYIATRSTNRLVVWDIQENIETINRPFLSGTANSVAFSPDGKRVAIASDPDQTIYVLDSQQGTELLQLEHNERVGDVAFSTNGKRILSHAKVWALGPGFDIVWDSQTGEQIAQLPYEFAYTAAISPDGESIATGGRDRTLRIWDSQTGTEIQRIDLNYPGSDNLPDLVGFVADSPIIWAETGGAIVGSWDIESGEEILRVANTGLIPKISRSGLLAATAHLGSNDADPNYISVWNTQSGQEIARIEDDEACTYSNYFAFSANNSYLATICFNTDPEEEDTFAIFDLKNGTKTLTPFDRTSSTSDFILSPDAQQLVIRYADEENTRTTTEVWNIKS